MKYKITFKTGSLNFAGTDANVSIKFFGDEIITNYLTLNAELNQFEKGDTDTFYFETKNIGEINKIAIKHNSKLFGAAWFLQNVIIECSTGKWIFNVNKWIEGENTYTINSKKLASYSLEVITGTIAGSGCNKNILLSIVGTDGYTNFINITEYTLNNKFITGQTEIINIYNEDVGEIEQINIKFEDESNNDSWYVNRILVRKNNSKRADSFPFFNWLERKKVLKSNLDLLEYTLKFYNGDVANAGTDANVYINIYGSKGYLEKLALNKLISRNAFEKGNVDYIKIANKDLGKIRKLRIWHDEKWLADGWFLNKISIKSSKDYRETVFPYYSWLDKSANPKSTNIEITTTQPALRPFYVIAHMVNTPAYVEESLVLGSNAIECDVTPKIENGTFTFDFFHGFRPDFDPDKINLMERSLSRTDSSIFLDSLKKLETKYKNFTLVIYDCKISEIPKNKLEQCGEEFAKKVMDRFYKNNYKNRVFSIFSIAKKKSETFIDGVLNAVPENFRTNIGFDLSMERYQTTEKLFAKKQFNNFWWGRGISSSVPIPLQHFLPQILLAAKKRSDRKIIKKIYYWTLDDPDSMARMLVTQLDGMVVNDPLRLLKVLEKEEFKHSYRLATRKDNPFSVI